MTMTKEPLQSIGVASRVPGMDDFSPHSQFKRSEELVSGSGVDTNDIAKTSF
jgi:hypothetical protein